VSTVLALFLSWLAATLLGILPRRVWERWEPPLPMKAAAFPAALLTLTAGFAIGLQGFLSFGQRVASSTNTWFIQNATEPHGLSDAQIAAVPYGTSLFTPIGFLLTPLGAFSAYLVVTSAVRLVSAYVGDPRGDFILSGAAAVVASAWNRGAIRTARKARERLEGPDVPDSLRRGAWLGIDADLVVLAARRKPGWEAGAIVMTDTEWFRLGAPFDTDTPAGLRTGYPLNRIEANEVVRRGLRYELPRTISSSSGSDGT
jgi:hypothetical protein